MESDSGLVSSINFLSNFMQDQYSLNNTATNTNTDSAPVKNSQVANILAMLNAITPS